MNFNILISISIMLLTMFGTKTIAQQSLSNALIQPRLSPDQRADQDVARLDSIVHLTADQKVQVKQLYVTFNEQRKQNKIAAAGDRDKLKQLNKATSQQNRDGLYKILTPAQQALFKQEMRDHRTQKMQNSQPVPQPGK